jgi:3-oxoacyl-[acyl-carrier-protein] synthase-1
MRRVVVTGLGIVSSIGNNTHEVQASLREGKSGILRAD